MKQSRRVFSAHNVLTILTFYLLGLGSGFAPTLFVFLFPAAHAVETGSSAEFWSNLLDFGAAESGSLFGKVAGVAMKAVSVNLTSKTNCCIQ